MAPRPALDALYHRLQDVLGREHADTLLARLPMHPADQLATRSDIDRLDARIDDFRAEFSSFRSEMRSEFSEIRSEIRTEMREINVALREQLRIYSTITIGSLTALTAIFSLVVTMIV